MDLNAFSSFFEIFAGLCLAFAGSKTFRSALNQNILQLYAPIDAMEAELKVQQSKLKVLTSERDVDKKRVAARAIAKNILKLNSIIREEAKFRSFPHGFKSMFLITAMFCVVVLMLGGFTQFFKCSEVAHVTLWLISAVVMFYNLYIYWVSFDDDKCGRNLPTWIPVTVLMLALVVAGLYVNFVTWLSSHIAGHAQDTRFQPHSRIDERFAIFVALSVAISPFLFHFIRVSKHKKKFVNMLERTHSDMTEEKDVSDLTDKIMEDESPESLLAMELKRNEEDDEGPVHETSG